MSAGSVVSRWLKLAVIGLVLISPTLQAQTVEYIHTDALGTPIAVTNASRVVIERSEYEPYGKLLNRPLTDGPGFTGHVQDAATGMTYMQQRYYDPGIGRFLSVDPVTANSGTGANFNRYWYANNNPYRFTDPDGRQSDAAGKEVGRWIRALWDNDGDFDKAKAQVDKQHEMDRKVAEVIVDFTAAGVVKDAVEVSIKAANGEDATGQGSGAVAGEVAGQAVESMLDGKIGDGAASAVGAAVGKVVGDTVESSVDRAVGGSVNRSSNKPVNTEPKPVQRPEPPDHRKPD